jgi:segregation and condensation protein A
LEKVFEIKLPQFEGPFDLLLFFIERDELDIQNIPIHTITEDFLAYIRQMNEFNMELASEFILVAATLMRIKAKMLLPRPEIDEQGNEIDPRKDLIERLILYKQYKEVCNDLQGMEEVRSLMTERGNIVKELAEVAQNTVYADELTNLTLFQLLNTFNKVIKRFDQEKNKTHHKVVQYPYTIAEQREFIVSQIRMREKMTFTDILYTCKDRVHAIFSFLAILELLQEQVVTITLGIGFNNFWLSTN